MPDPNKGWDRRTFLKAFAVLGMSAAGAVLLPTVFDAVRIGRRSIKVVQTRLRMGTFVTMTAVHESRHLAEEAIGRAFDEMDHLIAIFSRHDSNSPLWVLNRDGVVTDPPPQLVDVMLRVREFHGLTNGVFDVTVKPVLDLFADTVARRGLAPGDEEISAALSLVGLDWVDVSPRSIRLMQPGMGITLDGIAKGHIVDCASQVLGRQGLDNYLINAGGDIRARGARVNGTPWRIAVENPTGTATGYPAVIELTDGAVATSGNYEVYFDREKLFHHIVDPRTGLSPTHGASVSVVAPSVMQADALSTAVFVLEPSDGIGLVEGQRDSECLVLTGDGSQYQSRGWSALARSGSGGFG